MVWFQSCIYATTSVTIVSGAIAERSSPMGYMCHSCITAGLIYPVVVHWVWSDSGWLSVSNPSSFLGGLEDFAGGGVVHLLGGVVALVGCIIVGPRTGRFNAQTGAAIPMP